MTPRVSVILTTFNRARLLQRTLPTIVGQGLAAHEFEIIVIDDGSSDRTPEILAAAAAAHPQIHIIRQDNKGQPCARNAGVAIARGELILFLDDDILCSPGLLREHLAAHTSSQQSLLVLGTTLVSQESPHSLATAMMTAGAERFTVRLQEGKARWPDDALLDANTSVRRSVLLDVGPFDENVPAFCANTEVALRLTMRQQVQLRHAPLAIAEQIYTKSSFQYALRDGAAYGESEVMLCRKLPQFRPFASIGTLFTGNPFKRRLRKFIVRSLISPRLIFVPLIVLLGLLTKINLGGGLGARALSIWAGIEAFRSAIRFCGGWQCFEQEFGRTLAVLMYHHVGPAVTGTYPELTVSPGHFRKHLTWILEERFTPITIKQWLAWREAATPLPAKPILITFDDAYADLDQHVFPALASLKLPAAVFVVTDRIGGTNEWDERIGSGTHKILSADRVRFWSQGRIEFHSHTTSHPDLRKLNDTEIETELERSVRVLRELLNRHITAFAYPYGYLNERMIGIVREHFDCAFTTSPGLNGLSTNVHVLHRTQIGDGISRSSMLRCARDGEDMLELIRRSLGRLRHAIFFIKRHFRATSTSK